MSIIGDLKSCLNEIHGQVVDSATVDNFLSINDEVIKRHFHICKSLYDLNRRLGDDDKDCLLELYLGGLHTEQIWQQIELVSNWWPGCLLQAAKDDKKAKRKLKVPREITKKENLLADEKEDKDNDEDYDEIEEKITKKVRFADEIEDDEEKEGFEFDDGDDELKDDDSNDVEEESESDIDIDIERSPKKARLELENENNPFEMFKEALKKSKSQNREETNDKQEKVLKKATSVDDKFFCLSQMEAFLDKQDAIEQKKIDKKNDEDPYGDYDDIDDLDDDDEAAGSLKYDDFFDKPEEDETESVQDMEVEEQLRELVPEKDPKKLSSFEKRQSRMLNKIADLEDKSLEAKPWNLTGEVTATNRPINSLIDEQLDYTTASKPAALITEEITKSIEEKIIQRLISNVWDGPKRKIKTKEAAFNLKKKVVLDQDKSKLSLEQIYENEYLEQSQKKEEKLPADVDEIHQSMTSLFRKLDALCNFYYNPKPAVPDVEIISNEPVLNMEEVAPVAMSDAMALAPEEILDKNRHGLLGKTEMSKTDKKRSLRLKKKRQHFKHLDEDRRKKIIQLKAEKKAMLKSKTDDDLKTDRKVKKRSKPSKKK